MRIFEANISLQVCTFLKDFLNNTSSFENANQKMFDAFGINVFFENDDDFQALKESVSIVAISSVEEPDRAEYGDFQTNSALANRIAILLSAKQINPKIVIEPTCGKGSFIIAALKNFKTIEKIFAVEIYQPYIWESKFNILDFLLIPLMLGDLVFCFIIEMYSILILKRFVTIQGMKF